MAARTLLFATDVRCLLAGLVALFVGALAFVVVALLAVALPGVSGSWLTLPCTVMVMGVSAAGAWLVFGQGAQRFDPAPVADQDWQWGNTTP